MKLAFVAYDRPGYHAGPIVNARRLLPELKRRGHDPIGIFMYQDGGAPTVEYLRKEGVECRLRHIKGNTEDRIRWLLDQLEEIEPDIFVPNMSVPGWFAARWAREAGIPTVAVMRGDDPFYWDMIKQIVTGDPAWAVSGLVSVGASLAQRVEKLQPAHTKLAVIPSGVPVPKVSTAQIHPLRISYLGRLEHSPKNVKFLAQVMCQVLKRNPTSTGQFIGKGAALNELQIHVQQEGLKDRIDFPGSILPEELASHLEGSSIVLLASDHEGTPGALMDAMAHGLVPVCTATLGGVQELVRSNETGLIVERSVESFEIAISKLASDHSLWRSLSAAARKEILDNYSLEVAADRWLSFATSLLEDAGPRKPIKQPFLLRLPNVLPGLAAEDNRYVGPWRRVCRFANQKAKGLQRRWNVWRTTQGSLD